jgi:hypothetical protein
MGASKELPLADRLASLKLLGDRSAGVTTERIPRRSKFATQLRPVAWRSASIGPASAVHGSYESYVQCDVNDVVATQRRQQKQIQWFDDICIRLDNGRFAHGASFQAKVIRRYQTESNVICGGSTLIAELIVARSTEMIIVASAAI